MEGSECQVKSGLDLLGAGELLGGSEQCTDWIEMM